MNTISHLKKAHWPWPKMNIKEVAMQACNHNIYMPNIGYVHVHIYDGWKVEIGAAANSKRLWLNSLVSAHACLECYIQNDSGTSQFVEVGAEILKSYLQQYCSGEGIFESAWQDEHAVANRLFVITAFLHHACSSTATIVSEAINDIISQS